MTPDQHQSTVLASLRQLKVVPVLVVERVEFAVPLADALIEGGLPIAEVTFRTRHAADVICRIRAERLNVTVGAGTVLSVEDLMRAFEAGAMFGVAPGLNRTVAADARDMQFPFFPGVMTPSDIESALSLGFRMLKFFPAAAAGGVAMLKSLVAPYAHLGVEFIPTGGINLSNLRLYLDGPHVAAVGGTWIASAEDISRQAWGEISNRCRVVHQHIFETIDKL